MVTTSVVRTSTTEMQETFLFQRIQRTLAADPHATLADAAALVQQCPEQYQDNEIETVVRLAAGAGQLEIEDLIQGYVARHLRQQLADRRQKKARAA